VDNLKDAVRQFRRRPGLSVVIVAILAIGIGVTTGIFSLFHQILVRPLPVPEPERLVNLVPSPVPALSYAMFRDLEAAQNVFTALAGYDDVQVNLAYEDRPQSGSVHAVSGEYFQVLGLSPTLGRLIEPQDEPGVGEARVAVLAHDYWQRDLGGDPGVVGRTLAVNGQAFTIVGVAPAGFTGGAFGLRPRAFVPLTMLIELRGLPAEQVLNRSWRTSLNPFARLRPEIGMQEASIAINALRAEIIAEFEPESPSSRTIVLEPGAQGRRTAARTVFTQPLELLLGVTLVVLLVVCSNVANLLLARGATRANEMAIRAAIGADRWRLVAQLLAEASLLALLGGLGSLPIASLTVGVIVSFVPAEMVHEVSTALDPGVIGFAASMSLATVLAFGVAPAIAVSRTTRPAMARPVAHGLGGHRTTRVQGLLTTSQIALSVVLLVIAGLFAQSLASIARLDLGFDMESLVTFNVAPQRNGYDLERSEAVYERIEAALAAQPGVTGVASATIPLLTQSGWIRSVEGLEVAPGVDTAVATNVVSPGLFATLGVPLLAGRDLTSGDTAGSARVAIVNESFARRFNLGIDAIGRRFRPAGADADVEIVGLVADAAQSGTGVKTTVPPQYYLPMAQVDPLYLPSRYFYVRSAIDPEALLRVIPPAVAEVEPNLPVDGLRTLETQFDDDVYVDRLVTALSAGFAILATLLAAIGLYGMLSYTVAQRTREFGLRLALGAMPARLRAMMLGQVGMMTLIGAAVGVAVALALARIVEAMLFGVSGYDPLAFAAAVAVVAVAVLTASYFPARRAANVAPMEALRYE
jgi:predicted permease